MLFILLEIKKLNFRICCLYKNSKRLLQKDSQSPFAPTQFVNLLLIHHMKEFSIKKQLNLVANLMRENIPSSQGFTTRDIADIFEGTDGATTILIEGAPGIGKTMLCKEIAYRWACKKLLQGDRIVLLLFLRDPKVQNINDVEDLCQYMYPDIHRLDAEEIKICKACAKHIKSTEGAKITIILDGFDELSYVKSKNKFILDLLDKMVLPLCKVVVSSRPVKSKHLQQIADVRVEILGFTEQNKQHFINNELKGNYHKLATLNTYLKENSIINHLCQIPFMLSVLVCITKEYEELPKSRTELYRKFIIYTVSRFFQNLNPPKSPITNLGELPLQFKGYFFEICKYAYNALQCDKIVFTTSEIKANFPAFAYAPGSWSGLGLLKAAEYFSIEENSDCTSYNFLHLSIQEYLAAYYITTLYTIQQINVLQELFFVEKYLNMWIMYVGLSERPIALMHFLSGKSIFKLMCTALFSLDEISETITQSKIKCLYLFQCLSEIKNQKLYDLVSTLFEKGILDLANHTLLAKDIDTLTYILDKSTTTYWDELNLSHCHIGDSGCHQLCKTLLNDFDHSIIFNKINLSSNQLTTASLKAMADIIVCCKSQVLCLSDNFNRNSCTQIPYLAMKYAFKDTHRNCHLTICDNNQEAVVFNKLDKQTIITHLQSKQRITGVYFMNCNIDDEDVTALVNVITNKNLLCQVCLWNCYTSSSIVEHLLSNICQKEKKQLLLAYENSSADFDNIAFNFDNVMYPFLTLIYLNNVLFVLHGVNDIHIELIFSNAVEFFKTEKLTEVKISNCKINEDAISNLIQLFSKCRLKKVFLLSNQLKFHLLCQLITRAKLLPSLVEMLIEHDDMTTTDCCIIVDKLSNSQSHSVMIFCYNILRGYRSHDEQLNESDMETIICTILQLYKKDIPIIVYEKNLFTDDSSFIHDAFKSEPIPYVLLSKSILSVENVRNSHVVLMILKSSFYSNDLLKVVFSNCHLRNAKLTQLFPDAFSQCKFITNFTYINNNLNFRIIKMLYDNITLLPSLRDLILYERNLTMNNINVIINDLIRKKKSVSILIMTYDILLGYRCSSEVFNWAVNTNMMIKIVHLMYCTINQFTFESISSHNKLEELYLCNNELQVKAIKLATALNNISSLKVLDLNNNNITEEATHELSAAMNAKNSLEKLWLGSNHLGSSTVVDANDLNKVANITKLKCNNTKNIGNKLASALTLIIAKNKSLQLLALYNNDLNDDGVIKIAQSLCRHTKLKIIDLRNNNITEKSAEAFSSIISNNTGLEELYLSNNALQLGVITISIALKNISSLKVLDLRNNNNIPEEAADELSAAIRANNSLEKLWLCGNHLGSSTVMIVDALKQVTTLKELDLNNNQNRSKEFAATLTSILSDNNFMESLLLSDNKLNDDGIIKIAQSLCKHTKLKIINLQSNNITEKSAEALASIISSNTELEELYLGNNTMQLGVIVISTALKNISSLKVLDLANNNIPEKAADELSAAIRANNSLEKLWLNRNDLGSSTVMIVNALKQVTTLKELNLNDNQNRSEELAPALTFIISDNKSMESLLLSGNNLNDDSVIKIAQSLCKHTKLKIINLRSNNITEKSAEALASIISSNTGLEQLYLGNNTMQLGVITVSTALKSISSLKVLDLENNNIPEEAVDELSAAIRANSSLEKMRLNNNNLRSSMAVIAKTCHNSSLKELNFKNAEISKAAANDISAIIAFNSCIQLVSMSDNNLQSSGFMVIAQALKGISSLKFLYAYGINVTSAVPEELSSIIEHNLSMEELSLGDNLLGDGLIQIVDSCSRLTSLKNLELSHNCISPSQVVNFTSIVSKCNSLKALLLGGISLSVDENLYLNNSRIYEIHAFRTDTVNNEEQLGNYKFYIFSELSRMLFCRVLSFNYQHLNMMYHYDYTYISYQHKNKFYENEVDCELLSQEAKQRLSQIDSKAMISSLQIIRTLKVINLENNNIDEDAATELAGHLHCNNILEQLWLRGNELYDKGASIVLQSLHNLSTLLILDLSYNHLSSESADGIAVVVGNNCSLQQLWLDGNELLTRGVVRIASALKKLSSLRILSLCSNGITDDAAEEISNVITNNTLLVDLLLGNNQLESKCVCTITVAIRKLFILRKLDLSNNHITPDVTEELAVTLSNCTNLKQLFLNDNMLGTEGTMKIANALKCINTLQVLTLSSNNITENAADVLVDVLRNNISLKIVLISGNDLQTTGVNLIAQTAAKNITLQLLDVSNNNVREDEKENIKMLFDNYNNFTTIV